MFLIGSCQDLGVAWLYGAEGLAISFAGLLYLHEVVFVFFIVAWHSVSGRTKQGPEFR